MANKPFPEDVFVAQASARAAGIAVLGGADDALKFVRELSELLGEHKVYITICKPSLVPELARPAHRDGTAFRGRAIQAKFAGRCAVCASGFGVGTAILYDGDSKRAAHEACGTDGQP